MRERPEQVNHGSLTLHVERPDPRVALIEAASPGHREFFYVVAGDVSLTINAFEASDGAHPEARVHVIRKPFDWDMTPKDDPPSIGDDQDLLVRVWQILGRDS
ncbi:MAG: hypothetical protein ACFCVK_09360 [Acidimicrobiales bacterium]